ncbi:MAG: hypothetical protein ABEJ28_10740 [Salinigranum sp.]
MATSSSDARTTDRTHSLSKADLPYVLPRVGIAVVFFGFGLWELFVPHYWTAYVPALLADHAWTLRLVQFHGLFLTTTATAVLLPRYARAGAVAAALLLAEICLDILVANGLTSILLRDVGLLVVAAGLVWLPYSRAEASDD